MINYKNIFNIALTFFIIGTALFIAQLLVKTFSTLTIIGLYYVIFSVIINSIILIVLIVSLIMNPREKSTLKSIGILLANIPITFLYYCIVITFSI